MPLGMEVGIGPGNCVRWGPSYPQKKGHTHRTIAAHVYCGQTAGWMKTPFGTEVDLGPGHIVLDGVPALRERGTAAPPLFGICLLWSRSPISAELCGHVGKPGNLPPAFAKGSRLAAKYKQMLSSS